MNCKSFCVKGKTVRCFFLFFLLAAAFAGCSSENGDLIYENDNAEVYRDEKQNLYKNTEYGFKMSCVNEWEIKPDEDGYLAKFDYTNGASWLGLNVEKLEDPEADIDELQRMYAGRLKSGIVSLQRIRVQENEGFWISVESMEGRELEVKDKDGNAVEINEDNMAPSDPSAEKEDIIFFKADGYAYVFLYHAENAAAYSDLEPAVDEILASFEFI